MDWASTCRAERAAPGARTEIARALVPDADVADAVERGDVLSFPRTALRYAAPLQGRIVRALYDVRRVERVVAPGVLHAGGTDIYREELAVLSTYLGDGAAASVLSFDLSDDSGILDVASALVVYRTRTPLQTHDRSRTLVP
ncbi:MAG: hypothetical protein AB1778_07725 [Candidatus Bipolaricaulota bacterium]